MIVEMVLIGFINKAFYNVPSTALLSLNNQSL